MRFVQANHNNTHFPLWGTCLGFELLTTLTAGTKVLQACSSNDQATSLNMTADFRRSRLYNSIPKTLEKALRTTPITYNAHSWCLTLTLKKCWGNLKQKWKNERSDEKRKTHKTGAGHMATRLDNNNDSDGSNYLPHVQNEPVVRLLEGMVGCDPEYEYAGSCSGGNDTNEPAQKVTEMCNFVMKCMALTPGQQETPPQEPRPHLTVPVYMGYDDIKSVADFLGEL
ncbi:hypothetical protein HPB47_021854 [Ixodes persulcatus]|uniref:Uncharacterized protein n=1 Tax=Ixodes persulcatus TaxID=34615 RepID=A0AC60QBB7_IXOPE|nr:hypothetical protein HPB47_021854 [Ixodes persulcatus]